MKIQTALKITLGVFLVPIFLCVIYKFLIDQSIGPVVFFYSLVGAITVGVVLSISLSNKYKQNLALIGIILAPITWIILINYFMVITYVFGIKDYAEI